MFSPREKLDPTSRINYAKVYTIEYNVKVYFIGKIHSSDRHQVMADYKNTIGLPSEPLRDPGFEPIYESPEAPQDPGYGPGYGYEGAAGPSQ